MKTARCGPSRLRLVVVPDAAAATEVAYQALAAVLMEPAPRVGLATGRTFEPLFARIVAEEAKARIDLGACTFTHLDEFVDLPADGVGGMAHELQTKLFSRLVGSVAGFHPVRTDVADPAAGLVTLLRSLPRLDLQLLGIGNNGHVAFNEPGTPFSLEAQVTALEERTLQANSDRYLQTRPAKTALTMGPRAILEARQLILVATGAGKADAVRAMLEDPISTACPASIVRLHEHAMVILDEAAAAKLTGVAWRSPRRSPEVVLRAPDLDPGGPVVVLAPHPDDASISCGGLLASLPAGVEKHIVTMTTGSRAQVPGAATPEQVAALREAEARAEAKRLGGSATFLRGQFYDSKSFEPDDVQRLTDELVRMRPAWVIAPAAVDPHPTHRLARLIADAALQQLVDATDRPVDVFTSEGAWHQHTADDINALVVFDAAAEALKLNAIRAHQSQLTRVPFDEGAKALARLRGLGFSESHLGGAEPGTMRDLPLVEAFIRETYAPVAD